MAGEWHDAPLDELVDDIMDRRGVTPLKLGSDFVGHGYRVISAKAIKGRRVDLSADDPRFVDESTYRRWMKSALRADDVLLTSEAPLGEPAYVARDVEWCLGQRLFGIRTKKARLDGRFLFYALQSEQVRHDLLSRATGTTAQGIRQTELRLVRIPLPRLDEQRAIAHILGTLDDKIELNRRMNETLEAMARALFKSWFVDFDPVRAKAEGRDPSLPKPLADLFPSRLVDSELGEIPEGWEVRPLRDLTGYLARGIGPAYIESGGICVLNQKCIRHRRIDFAKARRHDPEKKSADARLLKRLDILVNSTGVGTLGRTAQLWHVPEPTITDSHVTVLRAALDVDPWFLGVGLTGREDEIEALGEGSTGQTELSRIRLGDMPCIVPPHELQTRFGVCAQDLLGRVSSSERESKSLAALRDALLPKLISGELRIHRARELRTGAQR